MGLIKGALRKGQSPFLVIVAGLFFFGISAIRTIKIDIFPDLNLPVIYVFTPHMAVIHPDQMEAYFGKNYNVNLLLFVSGVKSIGNERNISGLTLIKLTFTKGLIWPRPPRR